MKTDELKIYCDYMRKEAFNPIEVFSAGTETGSKLTGTAITWTLALAALIGGTAGYIGSQVTAPSSSDVENEQLKHLRNKLEKEIALGQRNLDTARMEQNYRASGARSGIAGRSLRI